MTPNTMAKGAAVLRQARKHLLEQGEIPADVPVDAMVARSWSRSFRAGLMPVGRLPEPSHLSSFQLARAIDRQQELLAHARPVMEYLYKGNCSMFAMYLVLN